MAVHLVHTGKFGAAVLADCLREGDVLTCSGLGERLVDADAIWVVMGQADLKLLETIYEAGGGRSLVCAFLCARYLVVTPLFDDSTPCPCCFRRRFLSMPPPGISNEAAFALATRAGVDSGFDSSTFAPILPAVARLWLGRQLSRRSRHAALIDQAGLRHLHAAPAAVHGCRCRGHEADRGRTTSFYEELFT